MTTKRITSPFDWVYSRDSVHQHGRVDKPKQARKKAKAKRKRQERDRKRNRK